MARRRKPGRVTPSKKPKPARCEPSPAPDGCGSACCHPVVLPYTQQQIAVDADAYEPATVRWVIDDLTPISYREGLSLAPWMQGRTFAVDPMGDELAVPHFYQCKNLDVDTGRCGIYQSRPQPCRTYPWGDGKPNGLTTLPPRCSYQADIPTATPVEFPTRR